MGEPLALCHALAIAARGLPVFPLQPASKLPFVTGNSKPKHRALAGGIHLATTDPVLIRRWFEIEPAMNYGVSTSEIVVLDCDVSGGKRGLDTIESFHLPPTFAVRTPSHGLHYYLAGPPAGQRDAGPGVNVRSHNGYVVGPGSVVNGRTYEIIADLPMAPVPDNVRTKLSTIGETRQLTVVDPADLDHPGAYDEGVALALQYPPAISGAGGNNHTYQFACELSDRNLTEDSIFEIMSAHWNYRCEPPWSDGELRRIVANACAYRRYEPGTRSATLDFADVAVLEAPKTDVEVKPAADEPEPSPFRPMMPLEHGALSLPPRQWLIRDFMEMNTLSAIVAAGASGKSLLSLGITIGLALGDLRWLGLQAEDEERRPQTVVLVNNEDDEHELQRRLIAICEHHRLNYDAAMRRIILHACPRDMPYVAFRQKGKNLVRDDKAFTHLETAIFANNASAFVLDPYAEVQEADEKDNSQVIRVTKEFRALAKRRKCAGILVHHSRKAPGASADGLAGNADTSRGASGLINMVRAMYTLFKMTQKEAEDYGLSESERRYFMRLDLAKGNHTAPGGGPRWFRSVNVDLSNGDKAPAVEVAELMTGDERDNVVRTRIVETLGEKLDVGTLAVVEAVRYLRQTPMFDDADPSELTVKIKRLFRKPVQIGRYVVQSDGKQIVTTIEDE